MFYDELNRSATEVLRANLTIASKRAYSFEVVSFRGSEGNVSPYLIEVVAYCDQRVSNRDILNASASFTIDYLGEKKVRHGFIARIVNKPHGQWGALLTVTLEPRIVRLDYNQQYRIFEHKSVPDILAQVLAASEPNLLPDDYEFKFVKQNNDISQALHEPLTYCVQYGESDWSFMIRLMSEWGLGFYIEQGEQTERLIITNGYLHHLINYPRRFNHIPYETDTSGVYHHGVITHFDVQMKVCPQRVRVKQDRESHPTSPLHHKTDQSHSLHHHRLAPTDALPYEAPKPERSFPQLTRHRHAHWYQDLSEQAFEYLAHTSQASESTMNTLIHAKSNHVGLGAGMTISVDGLDERRLQDNLWIVMESHFSGSVKGANLPESLKVETEYDYKGDITCVPLSYSTYRLPQVFPIPEARLCTGIVVGDKNGEVKTDDKNRVQVQLSWSGLNAENDAQSSAYLRVMQPWASDGFGMQFIPRVGDQVLVEFFGRSPNHPIIRGCLYHAKRPYPKAASEHCSGFASQTPDRQGRNEIWFDDTNGAEKITLSTTGNKVETIHKVHQTQVGGKQTLQVGGNQETRVGGSQLTHIKQDQQTRIEGSRITEVGKEMKLSTEGSLELYSKKNTLIGSDKSVHVNAKKEIVLTAGEGIHLQVGATHLTLTPSGITTFPMMMLSTDTPPFASEVAGALNLAGLSENAIGLNSAPQETENAKTQQTSQTSSMTKQGEKEIKVDYQWDTSEQENASIAILTLPEANEYLGLLEKDMNGEALLSEDNTENSLYDQLSSGKNYAGLASGTKGAYEMAKELGGFGATAKAVNINGVMNIVIEGYKPRYLDLGIRWQEATPQMLKMGHALNSVEGNIRFLKGNVFVEIVFSGAVNSVDYMLTDEKSLGEVVGQFSADVAKGVAAGVAAQAIVVGAAVGFAAIGIAIPTAVTLGLFALASFFIGNGISALDETYEFTDPMKREIERLIDES